MSGSTTRGDIGYTGEGFLNVPLNDNMAVRIVGWSKSEPGYIDNVRSTRVFPTSGIAIDNTSKIKNNYNDWQKYGARAALGINLNDSWTLTPSVMYQNTKSNGTFGFDPTVGDLKVAHAENEDSKDKFVQAALTLQGKIGSWDLTYAGAHLDRDDTTRSDYADYSFFYDTCCQYGSSMYDNDARAPHQVDFKASVLSDTGAQVFVRDEHRDSAGLSSAKGGFGWVVSVPLKGLAPGRYVLAVELQSRLSGVEPARKESEFRIK